LNEIEVQRTPATITANETELHRAIILLGSRKQTELKRVRAYWKRVLRRQLAISFKESKQVRHWQQKQKSRTWLEAFMEAECLRLRAGGM
jgi:hypothetical protein